MAVCTALLMFSCSGDDENSQSTPLQLKTTTSSPAKGEIGTKITIIGENFTDQAKVYLKNAKATITSVTATQLQVIAPANEAGECIIEVMVGAQKTENLRFTYVDYTPVVSSISPSSGTENTEITIIGEKELEKISKSRPYRSLHHGCDRSSCFCGCGIYTGLFTG